MCIHGDKSQPEREWVLKGMFQPEVLLKIYLIVNNFTVSFEGSYTNVTNNHLQNMLKFLCLNA